MRHYVLDASVTLKWFFADRDNEHFTERATALLWASYQKQIAFLQPPSLVSRSCRGIITRDSYCSPR